MFFFYFFKIVLPSSLNMEYFINACTIYATKSCALKVNQWNQLKDIHLIDAITISSNCMKASQHNQKYCGTTIDKYYFICLNDRISFKRNGSSSRPTLNQTILFKVQMYSTINSKIIAVKE